ncbi:MAG TPA: winged helix-turn-helix transcriptional regulator [Gemmatimonadaceae bacterium]|nr:winged helix-turn-helix transcriptional regulator [Gemmatimonadaceae bacterium]
MRTYRQYCGLARALDLVGDRWTLLIVRELLILGPSRYTDLRNGLPGIATNLLVDRLRELEEAGLVEREQAAPPVATALFRLTPRGQALEPVIRALGAWAGPTLGRWEAGEEFRSHWLALPLELHLVDHAPTRPPVTIEVRTGDRPLVIEAAGGTVHVRPGSAAAPDATVSGPPDLVLAMLLGRTSLAAARKHGVHVEGDTRALRRVQPSPRAG